MLQFFTEQPTVGLLVKKLVTYFIECRDSILFSQKLPNEH
jgi:hypothetical protein